MLRETPTTALIDAHWSFGQVAAAQGMETAITKARAMNVSSVAIAHSYHVGRLGEYAQMAAAAGLIGIVGCNTGEPTAAPFGGIGRALGPNPIAACVPAGDRAPFLMDFATTACAEGKLRVARSKGESVPVGWILDRNGNQTTLPQDFYDGGVILPAAGHKGYALCLLLDTLCGVLTGHGCGCLPEWHGGNGVFVMVLNIEAFMPRARFEETVRQLFAQVKAGPTAQGRARS